MLIGIYRECHSCSEELSRPHIGALYSFPPLILPFPRCLSFLLSYLFVLVSHCRLDRLLFVPFALVISTRLWRRPGAADFRQLAAMPCSRGVDSAFSFVALSTAPFSFLIFFFFPSFFFIIYYHHLFASHFTCKINYIFLYSKTFLLHSRTNNKQNLFILYSWANWINIIW